MQYKIERSTQALQLLPMQHPSTYLSAEFILKLKLNANRKSPLTPGGEGGRGGWVFLGGACMAGNKVEYYLDFIHINGQKGNILKI